MTARDFEMVIGLEVHCELSTQAKMFCSCPTGYGAKPNSQVCPICMGMPGTLPVLNRKVVEYGALAGLALGCTVHRESRLDRKNYFYPDLPKGYQISQLDHPLCEHGSLEIETSAGKKTIGITRLHIEEDAGKLIHDGKGTLIDCNRSGIPLIEIVSEPDIRSAEEAVEYLKVLRSRILYTGVSDCRMNEGSMRCDVNLSVRKIGDTTLGTRTEIKNLNSFSSVQTAIEAEFARQTETILNGGTVVQETLHFDQAGRRTLSMRSKENADDYRYFPDPDLPPIRLSEESMEALRHRLPAMPEVRRRKLMDRYALTPSEADRITVDPSICDWYESAAAETDYPGIAANFLIVELSDGPGKLSPGNLAALSDLVGSGRVSNVTAKKLLREMVESDADPEALVAERSLEQITDRGVLAELVAEVLSENPSIIVDYRAGKKKTAMSAVGRVMSKTGGRADPVRTGELVQAALEAGLK